MLADQQLFDDRFNDAVLQAIVWKSKKAEEASRKDPATNKTTEKRIKAGLRRLSEL